MSPNTLKLFRKSLGALAVGALAAAFAPMSAMAATTAANASIRNVAEVTYKDAGSVEQKVRSLAANVRVELLPAAPILTDAASVTVRQGDNTGLLRYVLTSGANGPDTYRLSQSTVDADVTDVASSEVLSPTAGTVFTLGATTLSVAAPAGTLALRVPYDGTDDGIINALAVGDFVSIGGVRYRVNAVNEATGTQLDATTNEPLNYATLTIARWNGTAEVAGGLQSAFTPGQLIAEEIDVTMAMNSGTVNVGTVNAPIYFGTHTTTVTARTDVSVNASNQPYSDTGVGILRVTRAALQVVKRVAIVTDAAPNPAPADFLAEVSAKPGTRLLYRIEVTNLGDSEADDVLVRDVLSEYLAYDTTVTPKYFTDLTKPYSDATEALPAGATFSYTPASRTFQFDRGDGFASTNRFVVYFGATLLNTP